MTLERMVVTESLLWQILALAALLGCVAFIVSGVRLSRRIAPSSWQEAQWLRLIGRMAGGDDSHVYGADDLHAVWRQWFRQLGAAYIGAGVGLLVGVGGSFALAQLALHAPFSLPEQLFYVCFVPPMWGIILGYACGSLVGARRRATTGGHGAVVAEALVSRRVLDYRTPLLTVPVAIPAIIYTALIILVAPKYSAFDAFDLQIYRAIHGHDIVLPPHWILAIYPGAVWLTVLLVECCVWARVKSAACITSPDAALARDASMAFTVLNVGTIYGPAMMAATMIGNMTMQLLVQTAVALDLDFLVFWAFAITMIVGYVSFFVVLFSTFEGRLGGRLTGWPWRQRAVRETGAAARGDGAV